MKKQLETYYSILEELKLYSSTLALLQWDQETKMPVKATDYRARQISKLSTLIHNISTSKSYTDAVNQLFEERDNLSAIEKRSVEYSKKNLDRSIKLPEKFVKEYSEVKSLAHKTWIDAKEKEDFEIFKPSLERIIELTKDYAKYIDDTKPVYDVLLEDYEEGITTEDIKGLFDPLKGELTDMVSKIDNSNDKPNAFHSIKYDADVVESLIIKMVEKIGFDFEAGAVGRVHHPFETSLSPKDIRINMSYHHGDLASTITGAIHELGHGLYEQNIDEKYHQTSLNQGIGLGVHESQSRLLENMIGRSEPFWKYFAGFLEGHFSEGKAYLHSLQVGTILRQLNHVQPSLIRIEADEITYNLHIILRFEVELAMLEEDFNLSDLPELWNSKMKELLGIVPEKLSKGVLQDVHWSLGAIGYFPTYSLGNVIAGQLWNKFNNEHRNWSKEVENGDFSTYFKWFDTNIWKHGSFYKSEELVKNVTGEYLNSKHLIGYLRDKYLL